MAKNAQGHGSTARLTALALRVVDEVMTGKHHSVQSVADAAACSKRAVYAILSKELTQAEIRRRASRDVTVLLPKAVQTLGALLDCNSSYSRMDASRELLALGGVRSEAAGGLSAGPITLTIQLTHTSPSAGGVVIEGQSREVEPAAVDYQPAVPADSDRAAEPVPAPVEAGE